VSALEVVLARPCLVAFGWAVLHSFWQSALLALAVRAVFDATPSPRARHAAATFALALQLGLVAATTLELANAAHVAAAPIGSAAGAQLVGAQLAVGAHGAARSLGATLIAAVVWAWSLGASITVARLAGGAWLVRRLRATAQPIEACWQARLDALRAKLGVTRRVTIAASYRVGAPLVVGIFYPLVLVPPAVLLRMDRRALEAILAHELAHVARADVLVSALVAVAEALFFYSPFVAWIAARSREEREHAADDLAARVVGDKLVYARALADLEGARSGPTLFALASNGGSLMHRVRRLVLPAAPSRGLSLASVTLTFALVGLGAVAACSAQHDAPEVGFVAHVPAAVARFAPEISTAATRHHVDPALLAILVTIESGGNPKAVSPSGAVGLMQLMPATAATLASERGEAAPTAAALADPATSLDLGADYLARQIERFGAIDLAAAAYNGGPDCVAAFVATGAPLPDETARYRERVKALYAQAQAQTQPQSDVQAR
jgi:beta-lactamase regulating signal transducer with metallopeptidase domain